MLSSPKSSVALQKNVIVLFVVAVPFSGLTNVTFGGLSSAAAYAVKLETLKMNVLPLYETSSHCGGLQPLNEALSPKATIGRGFVKLKLFKVISALVFKKGKFV